MTIRPATSALSLLAILVALFCIVVAHAAFSSETHEDTKSLVMQLGLSDLSLFTEARYTRHPSMADLHTAFQDHPVSLDHFPTGSLIAPPVRKNRDGDVGEIEGEWLR